MKAEGIVENAARIGEDVLGPALRDLAAKYPVIGEVRGEGVFWALELVSDPETRTPLPASEVGAIKAALFERGLLPFVSENRIHVVPPCTVSADEVAQAIDIYDAVFAAR